MPQLRITPEQVLSAYEQIGLTPLQNDFISADGCKACAIMAIHIAAGGESYINLALDRANNTYGFRYRECFIKGFDGYNQDYHHLSEFEKEAYADGEAAWEAVKHLAEVKASV